jgi:hypothetical protein
MPSSNSGVGSCRGPRSEFEMPGKHVMPGVSRNDLCDRVVPLTLATRRLKGWLKWVLAV